MNSPRDLSLFSPSDIHANIYIIYMYIYTHIYVWRIVYTFSTPPPTLIICSQWINCFLTTDMPVYQHQILQTINAIVIIILIKNGRPVKCAWGSSSWQTVTIHQAAQEVTHSPDTNLKVSLLELTSVCFLHDSHLHRTKEKSWNLVRSGDVLKRDPNIPFWDVFRLSDL